MWRRDAHHRFHQRRHGRVRDPRASGRGDIDSASDAGSWPRCGRCRMLGRTDSTPRLNQHRITNSISALLDKNSLTRIRSRSTGTARAMGHRSRIVGHPVGHGQYLRCNSRAVFTRRRHAVPESRLLSGSGILAEVALDLLLHPRVAASAPHWRRFHRTMTELVAVQECLGWRVRDMPNAALTRC